MPGRVSKIINLIGNMGWRYIGFRVRHELLRKSGRLQKKFPAAPPFRQYLALADWKQQGAKFFFKDRESLAFPKRPTAGLKAAFEDVRNGRLLLFNSIAAELGKDYDWVTNPDSGYKYDAHKHWTQIADLSKEAGDIKFVWEKSRFSYLYDIIRYDYHYNEDCSEMVFRDITGWIKANPVNCGPNYRCSQEMSLRVLNWTFALYYYRNSPHLTAGVFNDIQYAVYWHMHHVYENIDFSRIAVRNNHAITETLTLYLAGIFFPTLPGAANWKKKGKEWLEQEVAYQVYDDGTFLQFSMNYHRVVVQLLTWGIILAEKNGERFSDAVYDRAKKSVVFLRTCMVEENGWLPNYGANDGALFFKLGEAHFRDYRPQLAALARAIGMTAGLDAGFEDMLWYQPENKVTDAWQPAMGMHTFTKGGYYIIREPETLTFIKCGSHKDRPIQADNLHLDIWYKGENLLPDAGSYKYNTDEATMRYFSGTASHNTVMLADNDQMLKGGRFIWYYWSQRVAASLKQEPPYFVFDGTISAFTYLDKRIQHRRTVTKEQNVPVWRVKDEVMHLPPGMPVRQLWHVFPHCENKLIITASSQGTSLHAEVRDGWHSSLYGQKEPVREHVFTAANSIVEATIRVEA